MNLSSTFLSNIEDWVKDNAHLKLHSEDQVGWLLRNNPGIITPNATLSFIELYNSDIPTLDLISGLDAQHYVIVVVPGLFTSWYPGYMHSLLSGFVGLGIDIRKAPVHTEGSVLKNVELLIHFLKRVHSDTNKQVILVGHSKGAVDAASALAIHTEELRPIVAAFIAAQAPYGGAMLLNDLWNTVNRKSITLALVQSVFEGNGASLEDLTYQSRKTFLAEYPLPLDVFPTITLATSETSARSLLKATIHYVQVRYQRATDGCVSLDDAVIPGAPTVYLDNMDHFGIAYRGFPACCGSFSDPVRTLATLLRLVLEQKESFSATAPPV